MKTFLSRQEAAELISRLSPEEIKTALEYYILQTSPPEQLGATGETVSQLMKDSEPGEVMKDLLTDLRERFIFWARLCEL